MALLGARSMSEYISRGCMMYDDGSISLDLADTLNISSDTSLIFGIKISNNTSTTKYTAIAIGTDLIVEVVYNDPDFDLTVYGETTTLTQNVWHMVMIVKNDDDNIELFIDGVSVATKAELSSTADNVTIKCPSSRDDYGELSISNFILGNNIELTSDEATRNIYRNQLGYFRELSKEGLPDPLINFTFTDTGNLGLNIGLEADATLDGDVVAGADFKI